MIQFLNRSWIYPFYRAYSGLFFVIFIFVTGLLRGEEHLRIAHFFTERISNLIFPMIFFIAYEWLSIRFSRLWLSKQENSFIRNLLFLNPEQRRTWLLYVVFFLRLPVALYTFFLVIVAIIAGQYTVILILLLAAILRVSIYLKLIRKTLIWPHEKQYKRLPLFKMTGIRHLFILNFSLKQLFSQRLLSLLLSKMVSLGVLTILLVLIETVDYLQRFSAVVIFIAFLANIFISYDLFRFHHIDLNFFRSLPINPWNILAQTLFALVVLTMPEIVIIFRNFLTIIPMHILVWQILSGLLTLLFLYTYMVSGNLDLKMYLIRVFQGSILMILLLMYDIPAFLLVAGLSMGILFYFSRAYYRFETIFDQDH